MDSSAQEVLARPYVDAHGVNGFPLRIASGSPDSTAVRQSQPISKRSFFSLFATPDSMGITQVGGKTCPLTWCSEKSVSAGYTEVRCFSGWDPMWHESRDSDGI